jgi:hypothetical protein
MNAPMLLSPESLAKIDREIAKYPPEQKQSAVMAALAIAQDEKGWLSTETMDFVARLSRDAADRGVRGRDLLHDVRPQAGRPRTSSRSAPICPARCRGRTMRPST